jgi:transcriptional regulator with XRE-family HTH domain
MIFLRLKEIRITRGLKQKDIAKILNVQQGAISKYENGTVLLTQDQIIKLSIALEVTPNELLNFDEVYKEYVGYLLSLKKSDSTT